ncbi:hypothetical protein ABFP60_20820 [Clostridioides difficile]
MDRFDYAEKINDLLDKACSELDNNDFEILLSRVEGMIHDYE